MVQNIESRPGLRTESYSLQLKLDSEKGTGNITGIGNVFNINSNFWTLATITRIAETHAKLQNWRDHVVFVLNQSRFPHGTFRALISVLRIPAFYKYPGWCGGVMLACAQGRSNQYHQ